MLTCTGAEDSVESDGATGGLKDFHLRGKPLAVVSLVAHGFIIREAKGLSTRLSGEDNDSVECWEVIDPEHTPD